MRLWIVEVIVGEISILDMLIHKFYSNCFKRDNSFFFVMILLSSPVLLIRSIRHWHDNNSADGMHNGTSPGTIISHKHGKQEATSPGVFTERE